MPYSKPMTLNVVRTDDRIKQIMRFIDMEMNVISNRQKDYEKKLALAQTEGWIRRYKQTIGECSASWDTLDRLKATIIEKTR